MLRRATRYGVRVLAFTGAVAVLVALINVAVDPLQYYRIPTLWKPVYFPGHQRSRYVGLARNYDYDTVVIGSSLMENFLPSHLDRILGGHAMKLAISGSTPYEQRLILEQALGTGHVRRVVWGLEHGGFFAPVTRVRDDLGPFPYHMYRKWPFTNLEYLLSFGTLKLSYFALRGTGYRDLDTLDAWYGHVTFGRQQALKNWHGDCGYFTTTYHDGGADDLDDALLAQMRASTQANLIDVVRLHPDVAFDLIFTPISTFAYTPARTAYLPGFIPFRRFMLNALVAEPNVRVFDFSIASAITDNLDNYEDPIHFSLAVTDEMIEAMHDGRYQMRQADIEPNIAQLIAHVNGYNLCPVGALSTFHE